MERKEGRGPLAPGRRGLLVINPVAGRVRRLSPRLAEAAAWLRSRGMALEEAVSPRPGACTALARRAAAEGFDAVLAVGGDGTLNEVLNGLLGSDTALAPLPAGTGNVWALELGLPPARPLEVVRLLWERPARRADVGVAGGRAFLLWAGVGFDAQVLTHVTPAAKAREGIRAYVRAALRELRAYRGRHVRVRTDDGFLWEGRALLVLCSNIRRYAAFFPLVPWARIDDGILELSIAPGVRPRELLRPALWLLLGRRPTLRPPFYQRSVRWVEVEGEPPLSLQVDGDPWGQTPVRIEVLPRSVQVVLPEAGPGGWMGPLRIG